jgi:ubiquinone/menaquinone biosynthesis C-methylase UbiE
VSEASKYESLAQGWSERAYADAVAYLARRAELVVALGPPLVPGDTVLDLACGDGGLGEHLLARGLGYLGVDLSPAMVEAARARLAGRAEIVQADLNEFAPERPVAAATCFRALYYVRDRRAWLRRLAAFTEKKVVFDLNPRQYRLAAVRADLMAAGLDRLELRPFFQPQRRVLPAPLAALLRAAEEVGPLASLLLRLRFSYLCAAFRSRS